MSNTPAIFDTGLIRERLDRVTARGAEVFLAEHAANELAERLALVLRNFQTIATIGASHGALSQALAPILSPDTTVISLDPADCKAVAGLDALPLRNGSFDLITSVWNLGFVNDLPGTLIQILRALKPDGLFMAVLPGAGTLSELRNCFARAEMEMTGGISPRVAPFVDIRDAGALLQRAGFALPVTDSETVTVRYSDPLNLLRDLKAMGAANALTERLKRPLRRDLLLRVLEIYRDSYSDPDGKVRASFEMIHASGWSPHDSQQKPLQPGSARSRLADALGTSEVSIGDKSGKA